MNDAGNTKMIKLTLGSAATASYALAFLMYFFGLSNGVTEESINSVMFYTSISGAICLVLMIYSGKTGDDLLYPLILTIAVSTLAFFTVLLEAVFTVFFVGWSLVLDQSRHVNYLDAITMGNVKSAITPIIFFIPLASVFALDAAR